MTLLDKVLNFFFEIKAPVIETTKTTGFIRDTKTCNHRFKQGEVIQLDKDPKCVFCGESLQAIADAKYADMVLKEATDLPGHVILQNKITPVEL